MTSSRETGFGFERNDRRNRKGGNRETGRHGDRQGSRDSMGFVVDIDPI